MKHQLIILIIALGFFTCKKEINEPVQINLQNENFSSDVKIIQDEFEGTPIVLAGSSGKNFIVSFKRTLEDGTVLSFRNSSDALPVIMEDDEGNTWDIFGRAVEGERKGERLISTKSMMGYWFIFNAMYPGVDIYGEEPVTVERPVLPVGNGWAIPTSNVVHSLGFDAIPSIDSPEFVNQNAIVGDEDFTHLTDEGLVVGFVEGDQARAYPHSILTWNEIVNDSIDDVNFSVNYCPLTGTAQVWNRVVENQLTTFGVSGKLYNSNIMPYDRLTGSIWTQLEGKAVFGPSSGDKVTRLALVETTWATWKELYPSTKVLKTPVEFSWDYNENPYGGYIENTDLILFPVAHVDNRLLSKERVHGVIINHQAKVYRLEHF